MSREREGHDAARPTWAGAGRTAMRRATSADAAAVRELTRAAYAKWVPLLGREPRPMTANHDAAVRDHLVDLLGVGSETVALIEMAPAADHLLIVNVAVAPAHQGRGHGRALMAHAEEVARSLRLGEVRLYTNGLFAENLRLYDRLGYRVDREEGHPQLGVAVHMSKRLGTADAVPQPTGTPAEDTTMSIRVGIVGISGFGGGEAMRLVASHPSFELVYAAGEGSAGSRLVDRFPGVPAKLAELVIERWDPAALPTLDVLFASLPTGASAEALARVPKSVKIVDIGGDHRYAEGWAYGLADVWPAQIRGQTRVANPGCFPAATLTALAPLLADKLIEAGNIVIDAKTGISGAGRGGADSGFSYAESNENLVPYSLLKHVHMPEMARTIERLSGGSAAGLVFTPHLVPMTRGVLATIYCRGRATTGQCLDAARRFYAGRAFVRVTDKPPQTKWATGSNLAFVSYAADPGRDLVIAMGVVDNLGKGAAGQAVQNANLICGLPETAGLDSAPVWP